MVTSRLLNIPTPRSQLCGHERMQHTGERDGDSLRLFRGGDRDREPDLPPRQRPPAHRKSAHHMRMRGHNP